MSINGTRSEKPLLNLLSPVIRSLPFRSGAGLPNVAPWSTELFLNEVELFGATVRAPSCMVADALTKVVMIVGEGAESLLRRYRASALFVLESGDVWITPDWQDAVRLAA